MSSAALMFFLLGSSIFRGRGTLPRSLPKCFPSMLFLRHSTSAAVDAVSAAAGDNREALQPYHPRPDWVAFVDRLKSKGYFTESPAAGESEAGDYGVDDGDDVEAVYEDMNCLKEPCLSFARDRFDVFKCNFLNFSKNIGCLKCQEESPKRTSVDEVEMKKGDWICSKCNFLNFSKNIRCLKC